MTDNVHDMHSAPDLAKFTAEQQAEALRFKNQVMDGVRALGATTVAQARQNGWIEKVADGGRIHLINPAFKKDDRVLDPTAPEEILYNKITGQAEGVMFTGGSTQTVAGGIGGFHSHATGTMQASTDKFGMFHLYFTAGDDIAKAYTQAGPRRTDLQSL